MKFGNAMAILLTINNFKFQGMKKARFHVPTGYNIHIGQWEIYQGN